MVTVGIPTHERAVQDAIVASVGEIFPPGRGRQAIALTEVQARNGRADVLILHVSRPALERSIRLGISFKTETECDVAALLMESPSTDASRSAAQLGLSVGYFKKLVGSLECSGVLDTLRASTITPAVSSACIVEAKMSDWRTAFVQARRYKSMVTALAIAMPAETAVRLENRHLALMQLGLISVDDDSTNWLRKPEAAGLRRGAQYWLDELARRWWLDAFDASEVM